MTEEERDPELVRLRSKLADAVTNLNEVWAAIHEVTVTAQSLVASTELTEDEWDHARSTLVFVHDTWEKEF